MKNKKRWIIILVIAGVAIALAAVIYFLLCSKRYYPESIAPRTLHANETYKALIVGLWQKDEHIYYRFNADGTGHTWDIADDLTEDEASPFNWEAYDNAFMMTHKMKLRGIVPRYYELDRLNNFDLRFHDTYTTYILERIEDATADNP